MFMNALNIVIGPVIFFSLTTCISQFKNLAELGRVDWDICYGRENVNGTYRH